MTTKEPTLASVLADAVRRTAGGLSCAIPGIVKSYNSAYQKASVQPAIKVEDYDEEGELVWRELPIVQDVPVVFPGAGEYRITFPVAAGDKVLLIFCDRSIDKWKQNGSQTPNDTRAHDLSDAIAIPGLFTFNDVPTTAPTNALTIHADTAVVDATAIKLGSAAATSEVALKSDLGALKTAIEGWTPVGGDGGAALKAALTTLFLAWPVGSTKVKVE